MSWNRKHLLAAVLASGFTASTASVFAQQTTDPHHPPETAQAQPKAPSRGMMDGMMGGGMRGMMASCPMMGDGMSTHAEGRVAFLRAELGITEAQKAVWDAYAAALKKNLASMQAGQQGMMSVMAAKTPVERLDAQVAQMESRATALKELKAPVAALYATLSSEQMAKASQLLTGMGCMM